MIRIGRGGATPIALAGIAALFVAQYAWVAATNFSGYDEWLYVSLSSQRIISFPFENRPVVYLWHLPPAVLWPRALAAYFVAHGAYIVLTGWLTFALCRRLAPESALLAFMAGAFTATWAPSDHARLNTLALASYSGHTMGTLLAVVLFVESWVRRRAALLAAAMALALVAGRGTEVAVPVLAGAPLLLLWLPRRGPRATWTWVLAWECVPLVAGAMALWPVVFPPAEGSRQHALGLDAHPGHVLVRLAEQFGFHLLPLATTPPRELAHPAVALAAATCWLFYRLLAGADTAVIERRRAGGLVGLGLVMAALGYAALCLTGSLALPVRTEFFSGPGIGLALAGAIALAMSLAPARWRTLLGGALMVWVVAVGTGRTMAMQKDWGSWGAFPAQNSVLVQLTALAPDLRPNTLVVLVDERRTFPATFTFRHAVSYLYEGRALGIVWGGSEYLYPARFGAQGVTCEPWPVIRGPWRSPPTLHRYDEMLVVYHGADGRLRLLEQWPHERLPLPEGARYDARARIVHGKRPPEHGILRRDL